MKKWSMIILATILSVSFSYGATYWDELTKGYADTLYCPKGGACNMTTLTVGNLTVYDSYLNITVTDYYVNGTLNVTIINASQYCDQTGCYKIENFTYWLANGNDLYYNGGQVGIDTANPNWKLTVNATTNEGIVVSSGSSPRVAMIVPDGGRLGLYDNLGGLNVMLEGTANSDGYFNTGGKFGMGTSSPDKELHVKQTADTVNNGILLEGASGENFTLYVDSSGRGAFDSTGVMMFTNAGGGDITLNSDDDATLRADDDVSLRCGDDTANGFVYVKDGDGDIKVAFGEDGNSGFNVHDPQHTLSVNGTTNLNGSVGIRAPNPDVTLAINQSADDSGIKISGYDDMSSDSYQVYIDNTGKTQTISTDRMVIQSDVQIDYQINLAEGSVTYGVSPGGTEAYMIRPSGGASKSQLLFTSADNVGNQFVYSNYANRDKDHDHSTQTDPTLYIHSDTDPDTNNTQYLSLSHDKNNAVFGLGAGSYIFPNGSVGIGTDTPSELFHIYQDGNTRLKIEAAQGTQYPGFSVKHADQEWTYYISSSTDDFYMKDETASTEPFIIENAAPTNNFVIDSNGRVGIMMRNPAHTLGVNGTVNTTKVNATNYCDGSGCYTISDFTAATLSNSTSWNRTGTNVILAKTTDRVGIGTLSPNAQLALNGTMITTSTITFNASTNITNLITMNNEDNPWDGLDDIVLIDNKFYIKQDRRGKSSLNPALSVRGIYNELFNNASIQVEQTTSLRTDTYGMENNVYARGHHNTTETTPIALTEGFTGCENNAVFDTRNVTWNAIVKEGFTGTGMGNYVYDQQNYNNPSASYTLSAYGVYNLVSNEYATLSQGDITANLYGMMNIVQPSSIGTTNVYGIYNQPYYLGDTNYGYYNDDVYTVVNNYLGGDNSKQLMGASEDVATYFDGTCHIDAAEVGTPYRNFTGYAGVGIDSNVSLTNTEPVIWFDQAKEIGIVLVDDVDGLRMEWGNISEIV